jgi:hypothetical protein
LLFWNSDFHKVWKWILFLLFLWISLASFVFRFDLVILGLSFFWMGLDFVICGSCVYIKVAKALQSIPKSILRNLRFLLNRLAWFLFGEILMLLLLLNNLMDVLYRYAISWKIMCSSSYPSCSTGALYFYLFLLRDLPVNIFLRSQVFLLYFVVSLIQRICF